MKNITIKEIAKMANVSPTAVSFVLNNKEGVSEETRRKVQEIIDLTNYTPNRHSRRLYFKKSYNVAILVQESSSPFNDLFYLDITKGVLKKSKEYGYNIVFADMPDNKQNLPDIFTNGDADGIIFYQDLNDIILNQIKDIDVPYVVVDSHKAYNNIKYIMADYTESVYTATNYLINKGHENIGFICSSFIPDYYVQTFSGFKKALTENNIALNPAWIQDFARDEETAYQCMEEILKKRDLPTAVFCTGDIFAIGAMRCAKNKGLNVPGDISFVGIDDILLSRYIEPNLTTVKVDKIKMGSKAMELLMKMIDDQKVNSQVIKMDEIVERDSVRDIVK